MNAILIPKLGASGAAIGTLAAETAVWIVQFYSLKNEVMQAYKRIPYFPICIALVMGSVAALFIKTLSLGNFITLLISGCIFFGVYGILLILMKEPLVLEITEQLIAKIVKQK